MTVAEKTSARVDRLQREIDHLHDQLDSAKEDADDFERKYHDALDQIEQQDEEHAAASSKPFRPDMKRIDAGDWIRSSSQVVCEVCGYQFWEHPTVPGYMWMHRICDGRLVKL